MQGVGAVFGHLGGADGWDMVRGRPSTTAGWYGCWVLLTRPILTVLNHTQPALPYGPVSDLTSGSPRSSSNVVHARLTSELTSGLTSGLAGRGTPRRAAYILSNSMGQRCSSCGSSGAFTQPVQPAQPDELVDDSTEAEPALPAPLSPQLLTGGAAVNAKDNRGETPLSCARNLHKHALHQGAALEAAGGTE